MIDILNRWTRAVLYHSESANTIAEAIAEAVADAAIKNSVANLTDANLTRANLTRADLTRANLTDSNLTRANLTRANLTATRDDIWAVLSSAPGEVQGLLSALQAGRINGSTYEGECCCLVGTLAKVRKCSFEEIRGLKPNANRHAERFFLALRPGDTPETSQIAKLAYEWISEWLTRMRSAFGRAA